LTTTLLAVDDSKTMRKVIEITFSGEDFRLVLCGSAAEALGKLSERPSVALVDAGLDGTSGYELCRQLKAQQPGLGVLILSSKQQPYDRALGGQVGADDFADKPFDTQQLLDKVNALAKKAPGAGAPAPAPVAQPVGRATTLAYGAQVPAGLAAAPVPAPVQSAPPVGVGRSTAPGLAAGPAFASRAPAVAASAPAEVRAAPTPPTAPLSPAPSRAPAPVVAPALTNGADFAQKLGSLGLTPQQVEGVLSLSREVVERVVWEVVPTLAETLIREEIQRLTKD